MALRNRNLKAMTLMEMLVAIGIGALVMQGFSMLLFKAWDTNKFILEEGMASAAASRATNNVVIQLRGAQQGDNGDYPMISASSFDLVFYNNIDNDSAVERVHYFLDQANDQLKLGVSNPLATNPVTYPATDTTVTVVTNFVVNESDNPIFYYYNNNYPGDTTNNPLATPVNIGSIRMVQVKLLINIDPVHAPNNVYISSFVDLRNINGYD